MSEQTMTLSEQVKNYEAPFTRSNHTWRKTEDGAIDWFAVEGGFHNGPECETCGYHRCIHCNAGDLILDLGDTIQAGDEYFFTHSWLLARNIGEQVPDNSLPYRRLTHPSDVQRRFDELAHELTGDEGEESAEDVIRNYVAELRAEIERQSQQIHEMVKQPEPLNEGRMK